MSKWICKPAITTGIPVKKINNTTCEMLYQGYGIIIPYDTENPCESVRCIYKKFLKEFGFKELTDSDKVIIEEDDKKFLVFINGKEDIFLFKDKIFQE